VIIQSNFKDFYDYVAHLYGGGDPKIQYLRHRLRPINEFGWSPATEIDYPLKRSLHLLRPDRYSPFEYKYLVIAGRYYLLAKSETGEYYVLNKDQHPKQLANLTKARYFREKVTYETLVNCWDDDLIGLSVALNAPVFVIEGYHYDYRNRKTVLKIDSKIPILAELGIPALHSAEQIYQDIAYFIGNKMKESPDLKPPVNVSDKDRIVQHGFDLRQSFRHRV